MCRSLYPYAWSTKGIIWSSKAPCCGYIMCNYSIWENCLWSTVWFFNCWIQGKEERSKQAIFRFQPHHQPSWPCLSCEMESPIPAVYFRMRLLLSPTHTAHNYERRWHLWCPYSSLTWDMLPKKDCDRPSKNNNRILTIINPFARSFLAWDILPTKRLR